MRERAEAMVLASFAADSHALGAHGIYDRNEIASRFGRIDRLLPAPPGSPDDGRPRGSFTTYGEESLRVLRHLSNEGRFAADAFRKSLGAVHPATNALPDLAAAARLAPLVYLYRDDIAALTDLAGEQASITHSGGRARTCAGLFARVTWNALNGKTPRAALSSVADSFEAESSAEIAELVRQGIESASSATTEAADRFGQGASVESALPLTLHLIAKHEGSLENALIENVAAGGESAVRGMLVGMVLGAFHGREAIPDGWASELRAFKEIDSLLEDLEAAHVRAEMAGTP